MAIELIDPDERRIVRDVDLPGVTDGDPGTTYTIRPIAVEDHRRLSKARTTKQINKRSHQFEDVTDYEGLNDDVLDYVLVDWNGIQLKGQPVPCTREYKLKLDGTRNLAIKQLAGMNQIARAAEVREDSFRESA